METFEFKVLRPGAAAALPGESPHEPSHETRYLSNLVREEMCDHDGAREWLYLQTQPPQPNR